MPSNEEVTVTLTVEAWKVIVGFVRSSCQPKGKHWVKWGEEVNQIIQSSIDAVSGESPRKKLTRTVVASFNLCSVGYDAKTKTLKAQFCDRSVYQYYNVPREVYESLMKAKAPGSYFVNEIQHVFQSKTIGHEAIQTKNGNTEEELDADDSVDKPFLDYYHNSDFGQWIDVGGGNREWDSYVDDD